ncbi:uncharacterized protein PG986_011217 [Apiospora aurea]|uniref:Peptidase C14 caspase domain-containing protein n=1 Tax=Apiospora aurea TaxID=335848 RepID=A0ABR1Q4H6_9PEZI
MDIRKPTHYAILIGIDDYTDRPLKSCVRDARDVEMFLRGALGDSVEIHSLTASQYKYRQGESTQAHEESTHGPTYDNVVSTILAVASAATVGNFVYMHYSGHGCSKRTQSADYLDDVALVLLGEGQIPVQYLWGEELSSYIKLMIDNGLIVTLVLDCCFSGAVSRTDEPEVRFLPHDPAIDPGTSNMQMRGPLDAASYPGNRHVSMLPNWLLNPDGYTILTACGPNEQTEGVRFNGQSYGALSYYLLETLKYLGFTRRHKDIYGRLCAKLRASAIRNQNPILYGNKEQAFFGPMGTGRTATSITIIKRPDSKLELQGGSAHGLSEGDEVILSPLHSVEGGTMLPQCSVLAKIIEIRSFTSFLVISGETTKSPRTGWSATIISQARLRSLSIRLGLRLTDRKRWVSALKEKSLNAHDGGAEHPVAFELLLTTDQQYKILDELGDDLADIPSMSQDNTSIDQVCNTLEHLARFRLVRDLSNAADAISYLNSVVVQIDIAGRSYGPGCQIETGDDAKAELVIDNKRDEPIYVFPYSVGPCWEVEGIFYGTYIVVKPKQSLSKQLQMKIPNPMKDAGHDTCEDILKVIATSQPTSFDLFELPRLGDQPNNRKDHKIRRGGFDELESWTTMNFPVRVSLSVSVL